MSPWDVPEGFRRGENGTVIDLIVCTTCYAMVDMQFAEKHKNFCDSARIVLEHAARTP